MACGCGGSQQGGQGGSGSGSGQGSGSGSAPRGPGSPGYFWNGPERPQPPAPKPA